MSDLSDPDYEIAIADPSEDELVEKMARKICHCDLQITDGGFGEEIGSRTDAQWVEWVGHAKDALTAIKPTLARLAAENAKMREAIREIMRHCNNDGFGNPIVNERIIERCEATARAALGYQP